MAAACEELRTGVGDGGRLFRKSMMKGGTWGIGGGRGTEGGKGGGGVPTEYARGLVEWVGSTGGTGMGSKAKVWDGEWKRWEK